LSRENRARHKHNDHQRSRLQEKLAKAHGYLLQGLMAQGMSRASGPKTPTKLTPDHRIVQESS
jgi:hypothetical protein